MGSPDGVGLLLMIRWGATLILFVFCTLSAVEADAAVQSVIVCIQCHAVQPPKFSEPVKLWQKSIHSDHGISCNACHGGDPMNSANAMSPAHGFRGVPVPTAIPALCGGCHMGVMKHYTLSAHGRTLGKGGPTCVTCHGSHDIVSASLDLISKKNCSTCHTFDKARLIRSAMLKTEGMLKAIEQRIKVLKSQGVDTNSLEMRLFALRNRFHAMYHSLDVNRIKQESAHIQAELMKSGGVGGGVGTGPLTGGLAVGWALLAALCFYLIKKNVD